MSESHGPPKYVQIADSIRKAIVDGDLRPGDELPSERQLAAERRVARETASRALELLRREGYVRVGPPGSGTFVAKREPFHRQASERYQRARATGRIYPPGEVATILRAERDNDPPRWVLDALAIPGEQAFCRERLTLRDGVPVELSRSWFTPEIVAAAPALTVPSRILKGTVALVEDSTGRTGHTIQERVCARLADAETCRLLNLPSPAAVLVAQHVVLDPDGIALECAESFSPPDSWTVVSDYPVYP